MTNGENRHDDFIRTEYAALAEYFGKIITFRFTTAAFFIAAVGLVLGVKRPTTAHHLLLFAVTLGIWIVELRNRAIFDNLLRRARQIERRWADFADAQLPLFTHLTPMKAAGEVPGIPCNLQRYDQTRILWFGHFSARYVSHTVGLDVLYLSVMAYALWSLSSLISEFLGRYSMDPVRALLAFGIVFLGYRCVRAAPTAPAKWSYFFAIIGLALLVAAALLVFVGLRAV